MSFTGTVKEELIKNQGQGMHCREAELSALFAYAGRIEYDPEIRVVFSRDNEAALRKCFTLLDKTYNIETTVAWEQAENGANTVVLTKENAQANALVKHLCVDKPDPLLKKECCRRAYLRGVFLGAGFLGDPERGYHLEFVTNNDERANFIIKLLASFNVEAKKTIRRNKPVVYIKEFSQISDVLSIMEAHVSMMEYANAKIVKAVRGKINRRNNCDTANISKAVQAASKQIDDILFIQNKVGLENLPDSLREAATIRLENPEVSLTELGNLFNPPVGKSGVNHRLRKICEYAESLR